MRNAKAVTAVFGSMLLAITLTAGMAVAQSGAADSTKDSTTSQPAQPSQPDQSSQPAAPSEMKQSDSRTDVRSDSRSEKVIVETERTKFLGVDPMVAMIVGAVLFIIVIMAIVSMSRKSSSTGVETTRRTSI
jgi:preprotein translocase subunit SecG